MKIVQQTRLLLLLLLLAIVRWTAAAADNWAGAADGRVDVYTDEDQTHMQTQPRSLSNVSITALPCAQPSSPLDQTLAHSLHAALSFGETPNTSISNMPPQHAPDLITLHRWLHRILKQHKLATFTHQLLRDAVTVALGVKPAALLDFNLPPPVLDQVFQRIQATDAQLFASLVLLSLTCSSDDADRAVFMLHRPSFLSKPRLQPTAIPLVDISPSLPIPQLATDSAAAVITDQLHSFASSLSPALETRPSTSHVTLHSPPSVCLPTLCGWLLSYPVLYNFPSSPTLPSTNCLSNQPLTLFTLSLQPTALLTQCSPSFATDTGCVVLQSFSVPTGLLSESLVGSAVQAWEKRIAEVCNNEAVRPWVHQLTISKSAVCLPHVSL